MLGEKTINEVFGERFDVINREKCVVILKKKTVLETILKSKGR